MHLCQTKSAYCCRKEERKYYSSVFSGVDFGEYQEYNGLVGMEG